MQLNINPRILHLYQKINKDLIEITIICQKILLSVFLSRTIYLCNSEVTSVFFYIISHLTLDNLKLNELNH
jgi:hypothetical protein